MGSFSKTLSLSSDISLLIVNPFWRPIRQFKSILFATDFSDESRVAYEKVLSLAKQLKSRVLILHRSEGIDEETKVQRTSALQWAKKGQKEGIKCHVIIDSKWGESPAETILRRASQLPGMIAMAAYSGPVSRALLGSTTRKVIRFSTQPVWVIHPQRRKQIELFREENQSLLPNREAA
jgi:nucleotide-binding universal stress UspA family protein